MPSPTQRIAQLEKELHKYNLKRGQVRSLSAIREDIAKRIKILNQAHLELMSISTELFYYNMVDHLGHTKIETLSLKTCVTLLKELNLAQAKFKNDRDNKYILQCEKLTKRVQFVGYNMAKELLKNQSDEGFEFFVECPEEYKEKLKKHYFGLRRKENSRAVKECTDNLEKNYQMFITGEILLFERTFLKESANENYNKNETVDSALVCYLKETFSQILNKKNRAIVKAICMKISQQSEIERVDLIFKSLFHDKQNKDEKSIEI